MITIKCQHCGIGLDVKIGKKSKCPNCGKSNTGENIMPLKTISIDLETISDESVLPLLPSVEPDSRLKDPVKIAASIEKKKEEQIAKMSLSPTTATICCFGWATADSSGHLLLNESGTEKQLLKNIWGVLSEFDHFVTFNGINFDIPVLLMRSAIHRVGPSVNISTRKYTIQNHTDCRMVLGQWDKYASGTLDFYSRLFLGESSKQEVDGSKIQGMWDSGLYAEIAEYCESDCEKTLKIYDIISNYYLF